MSRKRGPIETPEYLAMVARMIRGAGRRVADADPEDLPAMLALSAALDEAIAEAVRGQNQQWERSWAEIARFAGVTKSAAYQRWGRAGDQQDRAAS